MGFSIRAQNCLRAGVPELLLGSRSSERPSQKEPGKTRRTTSGPCYTRSVMSSAMKRSRWMEKATFGAGCFWGVGEAVRQGEGVLDVAVGYNGGQTEKPTYREGWSGTTRPVGG